ncbi:hypothetical protein EJB05_36969, partial [Eragrostis curvula]
MFNWPLSPIELHHYTMPPRSLHILALPAAPQSHPCFPGSSSRILASAIHVLMGLPAVWFRTRTYAPNLVSLTLDDAGFRDEEPCRTPILDRMPKLQEAFVRLTQKNADCCSHADESGNCGHVDCDSCYGIEHGNSCLLLQGLSEAENLKLVAESNTFVFKRDLKQCPTFSNLKTLSLNDYWCVAPDFLALTCILKHSPILEKLGLQLFPEGSKYKFRIKGGLNPMELSAATKDLKTLKTVQIKCDAIDERIIKAVKFLSTFDICFHLDKVEILE